MADYTREEIARLAAIKKRINGKMENLGSSPENEQGFLGDSVDAVQHGLLSGAADLTDGVGYLTGSDTIRKGADYLRGQADNQINQMSHDGRDAFQGFGIQADESSPTGYGFKDESSLKGFGLNVLSGVGSFAPTMIPGGIAAKGISAAGKVAGAAGKGVKVEKAIDKASDVVGFGGVGALSIGGSTGNQAYETVANADFHTLKDAEIFQKEYWNLRKLKELDHVSALKQARENVARELATQAAKDGAIMGAITQGALGPVMGKLFRGEAGGIGKAAATGAITEGSQEFVESGGQTAISNMAVNPAVPTNTMDNVIGDALTGAVVGGPVGGGFGGAGSVLNRSPKTKDNTDDPLNLSEQDQGYQAVEQQLAEIEGLMVENGDNLTESEFAELEAKRNELLQKRAELTGEQPMNFSGPTENQEQPEQLALPNQNIIYGERPAPSQDQTQAREKSRSAFEDQFGEPRNTGREGEYLGQVFPEGTEQQQDGSVLDGEFSRDPLQLEAPEQTGDVPALEDAGIIYGEKPESNARPARSDGLTDPYTAPQPSRKNDNPIYQEIKRKQRLLEEQEQEAKRLRDGLKTRQQAEKQQAQQTQLDGLENKAEVKAAKGKAVKAYTPSNKPVDLEYQIVNADDLVTSNNDDLTPNTNYPQALQNRDRTTDSSRNQINSMANQLIPEKLSESADVSTGSPIVRNGIVESGNGRSLAIRKAYNEGKAANYKSYLEQNADRFGINPDELAQFEKPVLVRQRQTEMTPEELTAYTKDANTSEGQSLKPSEQAKSDSQRIQAEDLDLVNLPDSGDVAAPSNKAFISKFLGRLSDNERAGLVGKDGSLTQQGATRVQNAIFAKAYQSNDLIDEATDATTSDVKGVTNALVIAAPNYAKLNGDVPELTKTIVDAVSLIKKSRRDNIALQELTSQFDIEKGEPVDAATADLATFLNDNIRSAKRMGDGLSSLAIQAKSALQNSQSEGLFGTAPAPTVKGLINANEQIRQQRPATQSAKSESIAPNASESNGRSEQQQQAPGRATPNGAGSVAQGNGAGQPKLSKGGNPFKTESSARLSRTFKDTPNAEIVPVEGGFGVIEKAPSDKDVEPVQKSVDQDKLSNTQSKLSALKKQKAEKLKALLKSRAGRLNSGIDPEVMLAVAELGAVSIAEGSVKFAKWVRDLINTTRSVGIKDSDVKPFLKEAYGAISANPEKYDISDDLADQMDVPRDIRKFDLNTLEDDTDVSATSAEVERTGASQDQSATDKSTNANEPSRSRQSDGPAERATSKELRPNGGSSVPVYDGSLSGKGSTGGLFNEDGTASTNKNISDSRQSGRSNSNDDAGISSKPSETTATSEATKRLEKADLQTKSPTKHVAKWGDVSDIQKAIPALMPEQASDVSLVEKRFFDPAASTYGYLNTNGTGTGKTFVGLGVIKRLAQQGMNNALVVLPSDGIARQWVQAAKEYFDLDMYVLGDDGGAKLKDAGRGLTITTYATFGQNNELVKSRDKFDLIVADESQKFMGGQQSNKTAALNMLRAHTNHEQGSYHRARTFFADEQDSLNKKIERYQEKVADQYPTKEAALSAAREQYKTEQRQIDDKVRVKRESLAKEGQFETKVLFLSATPFPYVRNVDYAEGYLYRYEDYGDKHDGGYDNAFHGHNAFYVKNFGYRWRYHKLNQPGADVDQGLMERQFHETMKEQGVLGGRTLEVEADYKRDFIKVETAAGEKLDDLIEKWHDHSTEIEGEDGDDRPYAKLAETLNKSFDYTKRIKLLEAIKAEEAVDRAKKHLGKGRKVVIFHSYNVGGSVDPLIGVRQKHPELLAQFEAEFPKMTNISFGYLQRPLDLFKQEFGDRVRFYNGDVPAKARNEAKELFNQDDSGVDVIVVQQDAGEAGISLHDITGAKQRVLINIGVPVKPTQLIQIEGRIYRVGVKTDAQFENLTTGTAFERHIFASKIADRASTAENLGMGDLARSLKENISEGYLDAEFVDVGDNIGKGGKEADRGKETSAWDKAKSFYYSNLKRTSKTRSAEGDDYFATPEPLGLKMVEWLQSKGGDRLLEPSVGHGAIGRWFPGNTRNKATEKSYKLASMAEMVFSGEVINDPFEDLNVINKFEGVVMNPPFGRGGKLAYDHIEKAIRHLTNGGRIVALVPDGPASNKRLDNLLEDEKYSNIYQAAEVKLANGVFDRAGTGVKTKIIILDRFDKSEDAPNMQSVSFEAAENVNELFDRIENTLLRDRNEPTTDPIDPSLYMDYQGDPSNGRGGEKVYRAKLHGYMPIEVKKGIDKEAISEFGARPDRDERVYSFESDEARSDFAQFAARVIQEAKESGVKIEFEQPKKKAPSTPDVKNDHFEYLDETYTTKKGKEFVVTEMRDRQEYDTYSSLKDLAKEYGGWARGQKFMFPSKDDALSFNGAAKELLEANLSLTDSNGTISGSKADDIRKVVEPLIKQLHEENTFQVVQSVNDLPFAVRLMVKKQLSKSKGKNATVRGVNAGAKNYLIADGIKDEKEAVSIFLHEVVGHKAVLDMLGKEGDSIMERIAYSYGPKQLQDLIKAYGADFKTKEGRILLGKEKVAQMAENNEKPSLLGKLVANVKAWLRKFFPNIKWSDNDVLNMLATARGNVENRYMVKVDLDQETESDKSESTKKANLSVKNDLPDDIDKIISDTQAKPKSEVTLLDKAKDYAKKVSDIDLTVLKQGFIDSYASIESLEKEVNAGKLMDGQESAYKAALRTANLDSVMEVMMRKGALEIKDGAFQVKKGTKGLLEIFQPIADADHMALWETWAGARRAKRIIEEDTKANSEGIEQIKEYRSAIAKLRNTEPAKHTGGLTQWQQDMRIAKNGLEAAKLKAKQKRERNYNPIQIKKVLDYVANNKDLKSSFETAQKEWAVFNKAVLDMTEQAGLINPEARKLWENDDYVPFHRVSEAQEGESFSFLKRKKGLSGQKSGIEKLSGGVEKLNILESMVRNATHMTDASFKNVAMQRIVDIADGVAMEKMPSTKMDLAETKAMLETMGYDSSTMDNETLRIWANQLERYQSAGKGTVSVSENGQVKRYQVTDPTLFRAISQLGPMRVSGIMKVFQIPKRLLTTLVTSDPGFMAANFIRDTLSTWVTVDAKTTPLYDAIKGAAKGLKRSDSQWAMMAAGAGGGGYYDTAPESVRQHLSTLEKGGALHKPKQLWDAWMRIGQAGENANRIAVFDAILKDGGTVAEAAHQAQDVINFSKRGDWVAVQTLITMVPFMNARIQGLDRLWRGAKDNPKAFMMKGSIIMGAGLALLAANWDNEEYWDLDEWDRDANWHAWIGGKHIRIPKPFEVGAFFGTIPERAFEQMRDDADGKLLGERMLAMISGTFAMNLTPQLFKPAIDVAMNENGFTGNPILSMGDEYRTPEGQYSPWTSETMKQLAKSMPDSAPDWMRSPKRLEYLFKGYFGTLGGYALSLSDVGTETLVGVPTKPEMNISQLPVLKRFYKDGTAGSKHIGRFYDMLDEVNSLNVEIKSKIKERQVEDAKKLKMKNLEKLKVRKSLNRVASDLSTINARIKSVYTNKSMTARQKRELIDKLSLQRNEIASGASLRYYELFR